MHIEFTENNGGDIRAGLGISTEWSNRVDNLIADLMADKSGEYQSIAKIAQRVAIACSNSQELTYAMLYLGQMKGQADVLQKIGGFLAVSKKPE